MAKEYSYGIIPYKIVEHSIYILMNKTSSISDWNFFKGKQEKNETSKQTAIREFKEESGYTITMNMLETYFFRKNKRKDIGLYLVDFTLLDYEFDFNNSEIYFSTWIKLNSKYRFNKLNISTNQKLLYNDILLYFKPKLNYLLNIKGI